MVEKDAELSRLTIQIWNTTRTSLRFQVPGRSIWLAPGQSTEVDKAYLGTSELQVLCDSGAVRRGEPGAAPGAAAPAAAKSDAAPAGKSAAEPVEKAAIPDGLAPTGQAKAPGDATNPMKKKSS